MNGQFEQAALGIFCAMVLDSLDGRVARMTKPKVRWGTKWTACPTWCPSVAAPALIVYEWALKGMGQGWLDRRLCVLLGRGFAPGTFNTNIAGWSTSASSAVCLPAAAALVMGLIWVVTDMGESAKSLPWMVWMWLSILFFFFFFFRPSVSIH